MSISSTETLTGLHCDPAAESEWCQRWKGFLEEETTNIRRGMLDVRDAIVDVNAVQLALRTEQREMYIVPFTLTGIAHGNEQLVWPLKLGAPPTVPYWACWKGQPAPGKPGSLIKRICRNRSS
ncbi:hypothetical protein LPJ59_001693 [Coemansia sp. RSA 2399]|nr:hypothetical protein LPJ59_001693 [Coemansia sp. RSA 2399]KAJ1897706.1 hypothetical protein LPJ81_004481 [Coemansia sp. IMI 209127]